MDDSRGELRRAWTPPPAKASFRALLRQSGERQGLTSRAIETLVEQAQITYWRAGQRIFSPGDAQDLTNFVIAGAVKVVCRGRKDVPITVQMVKPGRWFGAAWFCDGPQRREFAAVAHVPSVVAMVTQDAMRHVFSHMPPENVARLLAYTWRILCRLLLERCLFLTLSLEDRVGYALVGLARDFGRPHAGGTLIDLPVRSADVADFVVGTRTNVSRCLASLQRAGLLERVGGRLLLSPELLARGAAPASDPDAAPISDATSDIDELGDEK